MNLTVMQIVHRIGLRFDDQKREEFSRAGVELKHDGIMTSFEIAEDDPRWERVLPLTRKFRVFDTVSTRFSQPELKAATYLGMMAVGNHGYPEPSDDNGYLAATFDLSDYCKACGTGAKQIAPFRLKKVPNLRNSILQLNWVLDEFFVSSEVWKSVFEPLKIGNRQVVLHKTGEPIPSIVQLDIRETADLNMEGRGEPVTCPECGRKKYPLALKGFFPKPPDASAAMFKSSPYFGTGALAFRLVMVSAILYRKIQDTGLRGLNFYPCAV